MNTVDDLMEVADAKGVDLDRNSAAFALGYNLGLRVKDCWNTPLKSSSMHFHFSMESNIEAYAAASLIMRNFIFEFKKISDCILCSWSCTAGSPEVYLHLIFAGDEGPIKYASKISECVGAECFPQDMITDSSNPEGSDDEFVDTETAPTSKRPPLKFRSVELCTSFDQRAKVFEAWEKYDPQLMVVLKGFQNYSSAFRTVPRHLDCVIIKCTFLAQDFMMDQAKQIAETALTNLQRSTACYSGQWNVHSSTLCREEIFVNADAAVRFFQAHARRAMMLLQESIMKLESVVVICNLDDSDKLRRLFDPIPVEVRENSIGFQTLPLL